MKSQSDGLAEEKEVLLSVKWKAIIADVIKSCQHHLVDKTSCSSSAVVRTLSLYTEGVGQEMGGVDNVPPATC